MTFSNDVHSAYITINIATQKLILHYFNTEKKPCKKEYEVSTAKSGINNLEGTGGTPLGKHIVKDKIGAGEALGTVFVGRVPTGEIYNAMLGEQNPERDWILTRILWLAGCEQGINLGESEHGCCDTYSRYIYIHGTPDSEPMGIPLSHGCIRMRNKDVAELFDLVEVGTIVIIRSA